MTKKKDEGAGALFLLTMALVLPFAAWYGFVISKLWAWFAAPLGAPHIGVWEAAGLVALARLLTFDSTLGRDDDKTALEKFVNGVMLGLLLPASFLGFGAIYHAFA